MVRVANAALLTVGTYHITVRVRDAMGTSFQKTLAITVTPTPLTHSVGDRVWPDLNGNDVQDPGASRGPVVRSR